MDEHRHRLVTSEAQIARARRWREAVERGDAEAAEAALAEMREADRAAELRTRARRLR